MEPRVAAEDLVGGLAGERHGGVAPHGGEEQIEGVVPVADPHREIPRADRGASDLRVGQRGAVEKDVLVVAADVFGERVDVRSVLGGRDVDRLEVLGLVGEVHREAADRLALRREMERGERGQGRGVESAGEQRAAGDVGDELALDDVVEELADVGDRLVLAVGVRFGAQLPVDGAVQPRAVEGDDLAGPHLAHTLPDGRAGSLGEGEQLAQAVESDDRLDDRVGEDRLRLGAEYDAVVRLVVVERLDAHAVADHHETFGAGVPDCEGIHAVEVFRQLLAPDEVAAQDHFGVRVGGEALARAAQFLAQFGEVVRLAASRPWTRPPPGVSTVIGWARPADR